MLIWQAYDKIWSTVEFCQPRHLDERPDPLNLTEYLANPLQEGVSLQQK